MSEKPSDVPAIGNTEIAVDAQVGTIERRVEDARSRISAILYESSLESALADLRFFQLIQAGNGVPDIDQVLGVFTPEMLEKASAFKYPELALKAKGVSSADMISAIDGHRIMRFQRETFVDGIYRGDLFAKKAENWSAHIVETGRDYFEENHFSPLGRRLRSFDEYKTANGVDGMDIQMFLAVIMQRLRKGNPAAFRVMPDAQPSADRHLPVAAWNPSWLNRRILLEKRENDARDGDILICRSVGGDIKM